MVRKYHSNRVIPIRTNDRLLIALFNHIDQTELRMQDVSDKSGVDKDLIYKWRAGKSSPRFDLLVAVCNGVGLEMYFGARPRRRQVSPEQLELKI